VAGTIQDARVREPGTWNSNRNRGKPENTIAFAILDADRNASGREG
jgi:hypothetical protein